MANIKKLPRLTDEEMQLFDRINSDRYGRRALYRGLFQGRPAAFLVDVVTLDDGQVEIIPLALLLDEGLFQQCDPALDPNEEE